MEQRRVSAVTWLASLVVAVFVLVLVVELLLPVLHALNGAVGTS